MKWNSSSVSNQSFDSFMTKFQAEEPMIHLLYSNCEKLLKVALGRLMKSGEYMHKKGKEFTKGKC